MKLSFLDVGDEKYGDCILVSGGGKTILVDGAHPGDFRQRGSTPSIPDQIAGVLGGKSPFKIDLLVVTHCHVDHIGCLPTLVMDGTIRVGSALVADPDLGFPAGAPQGGGDSSDRLADKVIAALREEPRTGFRSDAELDQFLADAANLEQRYRQLVATLEKNGTRVVRFVGIDDARSAKELAGLAAGFSDLGLSVLGPKQNHLLLCTKALAASTASARGAVARARAVDRAGSLDAGSLYRMLTGTSPALADALVSDDVSRFIDQPGRGAALNDQSIVLKLDSGDGAVLLTGDMQLARSEVSGVAPFMAELLGEVVAAGPYALVKLPHHASYNGFDEKVMAALPGTRSYVISTGRGDPGHPDRTVLALLQDHREALQWGRTDKNGRVDAQVAGGTATLSPSLGRLNDGTPNVGDSAPVPAPVRVAPSPPAAVSLLSGHEAVLSPTAAGQIVEVKARIPHVTTRVTITVEVDPGRAPALAGAALAPSDRRPASDPGGAPWGPLAGGRALPHLVFASNLYRLGANIGAEAAAAAAKVIRNAGHVLVDTAGENDPFTKVAQACREASGLSGVVLLGGYDVLPSETYDTLPPPLRGALGSGTNDLDDFVVWSDQRYGDTDGDRLANVPVSRIPDACSVAMVRGMLCPEPVPERGRRYGHRNIARPFAEAIFAGLIGEPGDMKVSEPTSPDLVNSADVDAASVYLMLHGSDANGALYWGERSRGGIVEALAVRNVPNRCSGVIFAGCCWGALTVLTPAVRHRAGDPFESLSIGQSIALSFLASGARAFVGCTGAHYSPFDQTGGENLNYFGGPMHRAFWSHFNAGDPPALALFNAKVDFIRGMPHGRRTAEEQAIEYKVLREFTCLGLGW